ncbi:MAG TPA: phosphotransferase [Chloroflexota bacterium]|nr:phosphotransferase [Chloroflexota bacterium]
MDGGRVDLNEVAAGLAQVFPDLEAITPLTPLGAGFRSAVVETAGGAVFRIGRNGDALAGYARESRILPALLPHLPVAVPAPRWFAGASDIFPFGVMGYPKVPGRSLEPRDVTGEMSLRLATQLGRFLAALHRVPVSEADIPRWDPQQAAANSGEIVLPLLRDVLAPAEYARVERWWQEFLADRLLRMDEPSLIHGDLWYEHVLVEAATGRITGIVDFETAAMGDPAQDLATQRYLGADFAGQVLAAYRAAGGDAGPSLAHRVRRLWELREFAGLEFVIRTGDSVEMADALRKLRSGPILSPTADR